MSRSPGGYAAVMTVSRLGTDRFSEQMSADETEAG